MHPPKNILLTQTRDNKIDYSGKLSREHLSSSRQRNPLATPQQRKNKPDAISTRRTKGSAAIKLFPVLDISLARITSQVLSPKNLIKILLEIHKAVLPRGRASKLGRKKNKNAKRELLRAEGRNRKQCMWRVIRRYARVSEQTRKLGTLRGMTLFTVGLIVEPVE